MRTSLICIMKSVIMSWHCNTNHDGHTDILYNDIAAGSNTMDNKEETIDYYNKSLSVCLDVLIRVLYIM